VTTPDQEEYSQLYSSITSFDSAVEFINNAKRKYDLEIEEERRFLKQIEEMFNMEDLELQKSGRKLIKTGAFIEQVGKKIKKQRLVTLFLFRYVNAFRYHKGTTTTI